MDSIPVIRWGVAMERNDIGGFVSYHDYAMLHERIEEIRDDMQRRIKIGKDQHDEIIRLRDELAASREEARRLADELSAMLAQESVESEVVGLRNSIKHLTSALRATNDDLGKSLRENHAMKAELAALRTQEPIGQIVMMDDGAHIPVWTNGTPDLYTKLYAAPATAAVPDDWVAAAKSILMSDYIKHHHPKRYATFKRLLAAAQERKP